MLNNPVARGMVAGILEPPARLLLKAHIELSKVEVRKISLAALHEARQRAVAG